MNKKVLIGIVVVMVVGYLLFSNKPTKQVPQPVETTEAPASEEVKLTLSEQNDSGESGTATMIEADGKVKVMLNLTGALPEGVEQPAHIHMGKCPDVGEVKYPLTSLVNGVSETMLDVTLDQLKAELPLAVNVHKSSEEVTVYVSCGDIVL